ncbi:conserved Plasmodium membrane protein, unknown function [Plasmodium gallinaceum]|uniref:LMBR1 domain-containing protein n=1 Tax=Plasmodium gallinaceum TaxID=5849 RepID=A0A1J1GRN6_PLAGA|nr:conserved Plasmodium membrane protein, unknown function [Plasmodium gallinaceum]CRG95090.1 conserved Plasmodium membrane protein, unknown function [Plasmodium gallinaceum]
MDIIIWFIFFIFILLIFASCWIFYKYFVKANESTLLIEVTFILSLSTSFILVLFIPIDIYLVSNGNLEISNFEINQKIVSKIYHFMFWILIFQAYVVVPFSYFYLKNKEKGKELEYIYELLDMKHTGESAVLFLMGCVVLIGVSFWVTYTSYGIACLPLSFLQQKDIDYEKKEIENRFINLKERERIIKNKYNSNSEVKGNDKYEILKIEQMKRVLSRYNYKLQEVEKISESWLSYIIGIIFTFRVITGLIFLSFSFIIYISLLASIIDKYFNSICAYKCGFVLEQINSIFNLLDSVLIFFSRFFPLDILVIASLAIYIFCCSLYGIVNVGIRIFFIPIYKLKPKKSSPETMLILCFLIIHIILVLIMTLLTIAPNYITYGIQNIKLSDKLGYIKCSLKNDKNSCKMSVLSVFFNKIFFGIPYFANSYFFSNWIFLIMYTFSFIHHIFFKKKSYLDNIDELDLNKDNFDENMNLLPLEKLT